MKLKNILLLGSIILLFGCKNISTTDIGEETLVSEADSLLYHYIKSKKLIGVSAGVLKGDKIIWQNAFGYIDVEKGIKADTSMLHRLASVTKPMTSVAILQLDEDGKIKLDDSIQKYLPQYPIKKEGQITVRQLLNHTSGTPAYKFFTSENKPTKQYNNLSDALKVFQDRKLTHIPGEEFSYTSYGYTIFGAIIEKISGLRYQQYMKENIWSICNMRNTDVEEFGKTYPNSLIKKETKIKSFELPIVEQHLKYGLGWIIEEHNDLGVIHYHDGH